MTHHDAVTGTHTAKVSQDYLDQIENAREIINKSLTSTI